jgi:DNA-directed RNA polymerase alpha subunit
VGSDAAITPAESSTLLGWGRSLTRSAELPPGPHRLILEKPSWEARLMPQEEPVPGSINSLRRPQRAWTVLQQEHIATLDQLRAAAGRIERFDNIGRKTAQTIRAELSRIKSNDKPRHYQGHWARP